jgi:DNA-binding protein YbaB
MMKKEQIELNVRTKKLLSESKAKMNINIDNLEADILNITDENKYITLSINGKQKILSLEIANILLNSSDKAEVIHQIKQFINRGIAITIEREARKINSVLSYEEIIQSILPEQIKILEYIELLRSELKKRLHDADDIEKKVESKSGNITIVISGALAITTLFISEDYLWGKNKNNIENELIESVNIAMQKVQYEYETRFKNIGAENKWMFQMD